MSLLIKGIIAIVVGSIIIYTGVNPTKLALNKDKIDLEKAEKLKPLFYFCGIGTILCGIYLVIQSFL